MNPTSDRSPNPASTSNEITRRNFMKKSVLTAGAITILGQGIGMATTPESCPAHTSGCTYVTEIKVEFTTTANTPAHASEDYALSGKQFVGTLKYKWVYCRDGQGVREAGPFNVYSGGHRSPNSSITQGHDTTCPQGTFNVAPNRDDPNTPAYGEELIGFLLDTSQTNPLRHYIEIHGPGVTTGCIAFEFADPFSEFDGRIRGNNYPNPFNGNKCIHADCKNKVPVQVKYTGVIPNWTGPL